MNMNRVGIFWDYENCAPPSGTPGYVVAERLRATCSAHGSVTQFRAYLELSTPPPTTPLPSASVEPSSSDLSRVPTSPKTLVLRSELQSSGVSLIDCPHNSRKNVADSMLACDLVCFALDNPTPPNPQIPYASYLPTSPYSIPNTPFSTMFPTSAPSPKTTIVLISGDRDFAYPLAVLKARKYEVGLIVPPGGAHPALRAQATWVMNWKDVLEGGSTHADGRYDVTTSTTPRGRADNVGVDGQTNGFAPSVQGVRRPSFAPRRGSISSPRRSSVSNSPNTVPPPPHLTTTSTVKIPVTLSFSTLETNEGPSTSLVSQPLPEGSFTSQLLSASRSSRKSPLRRSAAKAGSRPPSRAKSWLGARPNRSERMESETFQPAKPEQPRPQPLIVPVPLTASPIGSTGPSLAGMSPRAGRPHTPPLFSTNLASPPPPAAPPALPPPATPPTKAPTPPSKPPTPPRDALRAHRPSIPHVATPRPPIHESSQSTVGAPDFKGQNLDASAPASTSTSTLAAPAPKPGVTALQSLIPAAAALRPPVAIRPVLALPPSVQTSNTSTLAPATPVTPPASPPLRWARLQPVHDDTDGDGERSSMEKKRKEKAKERVDPVRSNQHHSLANIGEAAASGSKKNSMRLAVQVGMVLGGGEESSAISGVDSILRSYMERSPKVEHDDQKRHSLGEDRGTSTFPVEQKGEANVSSSPEAIDDDDEEEQFHEMFLATFSRPSVCSNAPRTPATVKLVSSELATEESAESAPGGVDPKRPRITTPRPVPRTSNSLPTLIPMMQSLLAGVEGGQPISSDHSVTVGVRLQSQEASSHEIAAEVDDSSERLYSRANSPPPAMLPPFHRRKTSPSKLPGSASDMTLDPLVNATYKEFQFLISVLEKCRRNGQEYPLRSLIGAEFTRDVFEQVKATSFKDHVQRAVTAGVVSVGGGPVQGREWISLNRNWQGFGLLMD
ncbi:NYN domain protein [Rhizoctonia solani AG-3 Rhs1AP]|uniref:NYN domain protein n=1 Tax=Rhizoctonia solani AG-3 Rhs1AP TaxID=1086054 RepID=X8J5V7_9AGAM|nr:NYN domain protein [Rhizoctonia solani AG-3 Rhs1AP]